MDITPDHFFHCILLIKRAINIRHDTVAHTLGYIAQIAGGTTAYIPRISQDGSRDCPDSIHDFFDGVEYTDKHLCTLLGLPMWKDY